MNTCLRISLLLLAFALSCCAHQRLPRANCSRHLERINVVAPVERSATPDAPTPDASEGSQ